MGRLELLEQLCTPHVLEKFAKITSLKEHFADCSHVFAWFKTLHLYYSLRCVVADFLRNYCY